MPTDCALVPFLHWLGRAPAPYRAVLLVLLHRLLDLLEAGAARGDPP